MLLGQASVMVFKVLNKLILILQLLLDHLKLFFGQLERGVALGSHFQFDVILLQLLDLLVQVCELRLVLLNFFFIFRDPLLVFGGQFGFVFFKLLDLALPLVVPFGFKELNLSLELLNEVFLLLELNILLEALDRVETALVAIDRCHQIFFKLIARQIS